LFFIAVILVGCSWGDKYNTLDVKQVEVVKVTIPDELLGRCKPDRPIDKNKYLKLKLYEREKYLTEYILYLYTVIKKCDIRIAKIKDLSTFAKPKPK
jgi:hypothetical protein